MQATNAGGTARPQGAKAMYAILAVPILGMSAFFWVIAHRVTKPDVPLVEAVQAGDEQLVRDHLLTGTSPDAVAGDGHSALYLAVVNRKPKIVNLLLDHNARPDNESRGLVTPVFQAALQGDTALVEELIERGAKTDVVSRSGDTLLHAAATSGNPELVEFFLRRGARVNAVNHSGATALCQAATANNLKSVDLLIEHKAKLNVQGDMKKTPLHLAVLKSNYDVVDHLLKAGADADIQDRAGVLPLAVALGSRDPQLADLLFTHTTEFHALDYNRSNLLHYAVRGNAGPEMVRKLLSKGIDPNRADFQGDTPLSLARRFKKPEIQRILIEAGARVPLRYLITDALHNTQPTRPRGGGGFKNAE